MDKFTIARTLDEISRYIELSDPQPFRARAFEKAARAVENLCYVLAPAQGGRHANGRETHGHTMIVDPWGEVVARVTTGPGVAIADVDHARIAAVRASLPALEHRTLHTH